MAEVQRDAGDGDLAGDAELLHEVLDAAVVGRAGKGHNKRADGDEGGYGPAPARGEVHGVKGVVVGKLDEKWASFGSESGV